VGRKRRSAEEARQEIMDIAEELLLTEGPDAVRVARIAKTMGVSHPAVLHHSGSAEGLREALYQQGARRLRDEMLSLIDSGPGALSPTRLDGILARMADPKKGKLLAWVLAQGRDPFPPKEERGLSIIASRLTNGSDVDPALNHKLMLVVLAMYGDAMMGDKVRARLGIDDASDRAQFRHWLLETLLS
jgi:AcrR family transcriptional regulator